MMNFSKEEKKIIIELICNEQAQMIVEDNSLYGSNKYKLL